VTIGRVGRARDAFKVRLLNALQRWRLKIECEFITRTAKKTEFDSELNKSLEVMFRSILLRSAPDGPVPGYRVWDC
jgi:hypothetical protein